jgi:phenylpyruvate tautomerase PptA (4-oxalocrotonate tautomerase family)
MHEPATFTVDIDLAKYLPILTGAGMPREQAEALTEVMADVLGKMGEAIQLVNKRQVSFEAGTTEALGHAGKVLKELTETLSAIGREVTADKRWP